MYAGAGSVRKHEFYINYCLSPFLNQVTANFAIVVLRIVCPPVNRLPRVDLLESTSHFSSTLIDLNHY